MLERIPVFGGVSDRALQHILERAETVSVRKGGLFFRENDRAKSMFVLVEGQVAVIKTTQGQEYELRRLGPGDCFGELELIDLCPRAASVRALTECTAIEIPATLMHQVYKIDATSYAMLQMNMGREVSRRLRKLDADIPDKWTGTVAPGGGRRWAMLAYVLGGAVLGYGLLHPVTMVIYMFEFAPPLGAGGQSVLTAVLERIGHAFRPSMGPMGVFFLLLGAGLGGLAGMFSRMLSKQGLVIAKNEMALGRDLETLLRLGENETTEFKSSLRWDRQLGKVNKAMEQAVVKTIAAFANGAGGTLVIGVDDRGQPAGLDEDLATLKRKDEDGFEQCVMQLVSSSLGTHVCSLAHIVFHACGDERVCRIQVEAAVNPVYLRDNADRRFFIRTGNSTRELNVEEAIRYIGNHWNESRRNRT